jgi:hypothetical protein
MGSGRMLPMLLSRFMAAGMSRRRFTMDFEEDMKFDFFAKSLSHPNRAQGARRRKTTFYERIKFAFVKTGVP